MQKRTLDLLPEIKERLAGFGAQIKAMRQQNQITATDLAQRVGISRMTLLAVEKGTGTVAMGIYAAVLHALNGLDAGLCDLCQKKSPRKVNLNDWVNRQYAMQKSMPVELRVAERGNHKYRSTAEDDALIFAAQRAWNNAIKTGWIKKTKEGYKLCEISEED